MVTATKCTNKCDARPELLLLFWRTRCRRRWSDLKVPISTTTATTDTRYPLLLSLPVPVPIPLPATRYPLPATRYSLPLTLPSTTITCADFESNQRPFRRCYWVPTWSTIMGSIPYKRQLCFSKSTFLTVARTRVWKVVEIGSKSL